MTKFIYLLFALFLTASLSSCGAGVPVKANDQQELAGYTLKNKKEIMEQQILHKKGKTIIVIP